MHIAALTRCCHVGYHTKWVEGDIFEQGFKETFEPEFRLERAHWLRSVKAVVTWEITVSKLCAWMDVVDMLRCHFGP
jgi:hypothetical protein